MKRGIALGWRRGITGCVIALGLSLGACRREPAPASRAVEQEAYAPGLGEIMTFQQMRHVKLWLAGEAGNWQLARYEVDELTEGFDDVVKYHPTHKDSPMAPRDLVPRMIVGPLAQVQKAIDAHDRAAFEQAYDALTAGCNSCHSAMSFGFNVVVRPTGNPYSDQRFAVAP